MDTENGRIIWETDFAAALAQARDTRREILIYFHKPH
jgi:hypothetical protein